jgi:molecular chaperone GrpE
MRPLNKPADASVGAAAQAGDEVTTPVASSPGHAPEPGSGTAEPGTAEPESAEPRSESPDIAPSVPAGEPEAPVGPAAATGPVVVDDDERGADQDPEDDGHEHELVQRDLEELAAKAEKAEEYLSLAQRTKADFENFRKRAARDAAAAQERGVVRLAKELLPAVDNLDRAVQAAAAANGNAAEDTLASGVKLVHADVLAALARVGIEPYSPVGEAFDPSWHEAVAQQPIEGAEPGTVVEVYQQGYRLGESVLRPARVLVAG